MKENFKNSYSTYRIPDRVLPRFKKYFSFPLQLEHALKVTEIMFHDQARTESLLMDSLEQLKKLFMCSYSTFQKTETEKEFKVCK